MNCCWKRKTREPPSLELAPSAAANRDMTVITYSYGRDSKPYVSHYPGKNITLKQFKSILTKKGNFRYFFKRISDEFEKGGVVLEEAYDNDEVLPLWEGKIVCVIETGGR